MTDSTVQEWPDDWPICYSGDISDELARKHAAFKLNCAPEHVEILRHNVVLCRYNPNQEEDGDD